MKKIIVVISIIAILLILCSCKEHTHTKSKEFSSNGNYHWNACTDKDCTERLELSPHIWDSGKITKEPTKEEYGTKIYKCTVCEKTKSESVKYEPKTTVNQNGWETAFYKEKFSNVTFTIEETIANLKKVYKVQANRSVVYLQVTTYEDGVQTDYYGVYQEDYLRYEFSSKEQTMDDVSAKVVTDAMSSLNVLDDYGLDFGEMFNTFIYNENEKQYEGIDLSSKNFAMKKASVKIEDGDIKEISATYNENVEHYVNVSFSDYGCTEPAPPEK